MLNFRLKSLHSKCWNSPTLMTWASFLCRSLSMIVVLPLLLTRLETAEITIWYLFMTLIGLQAVVDAGFSPTFTRAVAYGMGGVSLQELNVSRHAVNDINNSQTLGPIIATMKRVYLLLGIVWTLLLVVLGTLVLAKPMSAVRDVQNAWVAWAVIVIVSWCSLQGTMYGAYLQGINQIALLRRWETVTVLGSIATSALVLLSGGGLLGLVIANQSWQIVFALRNWWLAQKAEHGLLRRCRGNFSREVFRAMWPSTWRSGLGILMSYGLIQASGIIYAQVGKTEDIAAYLLGLRLVQMVSQFSQAPFYSKIPILSRYYAEGRHQELIETAKRGMLLSHFSFVLGIVSLGLAGEPLLTLMRSHASFPESGLWAFMGMAFFVERYGAMHIQLYSTTNHIIWHTANGISGAIYIIVSLLLFQAIGVFAFPAGIFIGYAGFYSWYAAVHAYRYFKMNFLSFERGAALVPFVIIVFYFGACIFASTYDFSYIKLQKMHAHKVPA